MTSVDLSDCIFSNLTLNNFDFSNCVLDGVLFEDCTLVECDFSYCSIRDAEFRKCNLANAIFLQASLQGAVFERSALDGTDFSESNYLTTLQIRTSTGNEYTLLPDDVHPLHLGMISLISPMKTKVMTMRTNPRIYPKSLSVYSRQSRPLGSTTG